MTSRLFSGGLNSLTALNHRLIAATSSSETSVAEQEGNSILNVSADESGYTDPDEEEEAVTDPEVRGRFSNVDPFEYNRIKEWIEANVFGGETTGMASLINAFVNEWDVRYRTEQGLRKTDRLDKGATLEDLLQNDRFLNGATWLPVTGVGGLPPLFSTVLPDRDDNGEETGDMTAYIATASPLAGIEFRTVEQVAERSTAADQSVFNRVIRSNSDLARELFSRAIKSKRAGNIPIPGGAGTLTGIGDRAGEGVMDLTRRMPATEAPPVVSAEEIADVYAKAIGTGSTRTGTTSTREGIVFDRDQLIAEASGLYNRWFLSPDEAPQSVIGNLVDGFTRQAQAFWMGQGGRLDFDTYVRGKLRADPRWSAIFKYKTPGETEEQFLSRFGQPIAGLGQTSEFTRAQTEAAVTSGAGPAEQLERVSRTREVEQGGGFSQRLAQTLAGIGVG